MNPTYAKLYKRVKSELEGNNLAVLDLCLFDYDKHELTVRIEPVESLEKIDEKLSEIAKDYDIKYKIITR